MLGLRARAGRQVVVGSHPSARAPIVRAGSSGSTPRRLHAWRDRWQAFR
ncbi:hypothetical protein ACFV4N_06085 [Actinosynnema sp. NPDC059797]